MTLSTLAAVARDRKLVYGASVPTAAMAGATTDTPEFTVFTSKQANSDDGGESVSSVTWTPNAAVAGADTNNFTLNVFRRSSAGAKTGGTTNNGLVAQLVFDHLQAPAAFTDVSIPLTTPANVTINAGDRLTCSLTHNGTGIAAPAGQLNVDVKRT